MSKSVKHPMGFYIKSSEQIDRVPLDCPICELTIRDQTDMLAFMNYDCCEECKVTWAEPYSEQWKSGWRPSKSKIDKYRENLLSRPSYLVI